MTFLWCDFYVLLAIQMEQTSTLWFSQREAVNPFPLKPPLWAHWNHEFEERDEHNHFICFYAVNKATLDPSPWAQWKGNGHKTVHSCKTILASQSISTHHSMPPNGNCTCSHGQYAALFNSLGLPTRYSSNGRVKGVLQGQFTPMTESNVFCRVSSHQWQSQMCSAVSVHTNNVRHEESALLEFIIQDFSLFCGKGKTFQRPNVHDKCCLWIQNIPFLTRKATMWN